MPIVRNVPYEVTRYERAARERGVEVIIVDGGSEDGTLTTACLRARAVTSGRRWESRGVWRTIVLMWRLRWAYWRGVPASVLANLYE